MTAFKSHLRVEGSLQLSLCPSGCSYGLFGSVIHQLLKLLLLLLRQNLRLSHLLPTKVLLEENLLTSGSTSGKTGSDPAQDLARLLNAQLGGSSRLLGDLITGLRETKKHFKFTTFIQISVVEAAYLLQCPDVIVNVYLVDVFLEVDSEKPGASGHADWVQGGVDGLGGSAQRADGTTKKIIPYVRV